MRSGRADVYPRPMALWSVMVVSGVLVAAPAMAQVRETGVVSGDAPTRTAVEWTVADTPAERAAAQVTADGPGIRVGASAPVRVLRSGRPLTGTYTIHAQFGPAASGTAEFGLIVGAERATSLLCGLRRDGSAVLHRGPISDVLAWVPLGEDRAAPVWGGGFDLLEVRVTATLATCLVNGRATGSVPITPGALDGTPGLYVGSGTTLAVRRFTVQAADLRP